MNVIPFPKREAAGSTASRSAALPAVSPHSGGAVFLSERKKGRKVVDMVGRRFARLVVTDRDVSRKGDQARWHAKCDCGSSVSVVGSALRQGNTLSCGCYLRDICTRHGRRHTPEYKVWLNLIQRCTNPKNKSFKNYGGRGIKVCDRWRQFENFFADMGCRPNPALMIERMNNDGDYSPDNCCWATRSQQNKNRRRSAYERKKS